MSRLAHVPEKWEPVSRLREALRTVRHFWLDASAGEGRSEKAMRKRRKNRSGESRRARLGAFRRQAETMQVGAVHIEPHLGAIGIRTKPVHQPPKPRRVIHFDEMGHLVDD